MPNWRLFLRRLLRTRGWELRRFDLDLRLDTFLWSLFPPLGINCVIDVGARYSEYGRFLRNNGYTGKIHSFEPVSANVERLRQESAGDADWTVHHWVLVRPSAQSPDRRHPAAVPAQGSGS